MMLVDLTAHLVAWGTAFLIVGPIVLPKRSTGAEIALVVGLTVTGWAYGWFSGLYNGYVGRERTSTTLKTIRVLSAVTMLSALAGVAFNLAAKELMVGIALVWTVMILGRALVNARARVRRSHGKDHDRVIIVGTNHEAHQFIELLDLYPELGLDPVGVVGNAAEASIKGLEEHYCGPLRAVDTCVRERDARFAVVMTGAIPAGRLQEVMDLLRETDAELMLSADLGLVHQRRLQPQPIAVAPMFRVGEDAPREARLKLKRLIDVTAAVLALVVTLPLQLLAAIAIKLSDRGPILYRQTRMGAEGRRFEMMRFRTMAPGTHRSADAVHHHAVWSDPRMTKVGRLLEITGINEIPEFWNILRGEMSLVGPKPGYPALDADARPLAMAPGLTGLWRTEANLYPTSAARHQVDDLYMENWSTSLDIGILVSSIELIIVRFLRGASWRHTSDKVTTPTIAPAHHPITGVGSNAAA